jgi:hypothetical protein
MLDPLNLLIILLTSIRGAKEESQQSVDCFIPVSKQTLLSLLGIVGTVEWARIELAYRMKGSDKKTLR